MNIDNFHLGSLNGSINVGKFRSAKGAFHLVHTHLGGGGSSLLYISIAYYMQKGGGWVKIACKIGYVLNGRPQI